MKVANQSAMTKAFKNGKPGEVYKLSGAYQGKDYTINGRGKEITYDFSGATLTKCVVTIKGDRVKIVGGNWKDSMVLIKGNNNRVTKARFMNGAPGGNRSKRHSAVCIVGNSSKNRVDHNKVVKWERRTLRCTDLTKKTKGNIFEYNYIYIHDMKAKKKSNAGEAIQSGKNQKDSLYSPGTIIRYNLFVSCNADSEVISLKSSGNKVIGNTFVNTTGGLTTKQGSSCVLSSNTFVKSKGANIMGDKNEVSYNKFVDSDLTLSSGDGTAEDSKKRKGNKFVFEGMHPASRKTLVCFNEFENGSRFTIGRKATGGKQYYPGDLRPKGNKKSNRHVLADAHIYGNEGAKVKRAGQVDQIKNDRVARKNIKPVQLKASDVGPRAAGKKKNKAQSDK